jgi:hypothetical protein
MAGEQTAPMRWWRLAPWSLNRLMRTSDRLESAAVLLVVVCVLLLIPVAAAVGTATYTRLGDQARTDRETGHQVPAVLLEDSWVGLSETNLSPEESFLAPAEWIVDGTSHTGEVPTEAGAKSGQTVGVWTDPRGNLVDVPKTGAENAYTAVGVALGVWISSAAICFGILFGIFWAARKYQMSQWGREWRDLGTTPGWPVG